MEVRESNPHTCTRWPKLQVFQILRNPCDLHRQQGDKYKNFESVIYNVVEVRESNPLHRAGLLISV